MTITIGTFSTNALLAQPYGYDGEARTGLTARCFRVEGLLTPTQWQSLLSVYNSWRDNRLTDADTYASGTTGSTVLLTSTAANGISVTNVPCWFIDAPKGEQAGAYISASTQLVDAAQALEVVLRTKEKERQGTDAQTPTFGTITFGNAVVTLRKPMEARQDGPNVALTATGTSYVTGALRAHKVRQIEGWITTGTYDDLLSWYDSTIAAVPQTNSWFPIEPPSATAEAIVYSGIKTTRYTVTLKVLQIL